MKLTLIWFNLQRDGTGNGLSNIKDTFAESFEKLESGLVRVNPYCRFRKNRSTFIKNTCLVAEFFSIFLENYDQEAMQFDPYCPFKDLVYCLYQDLRKVST